MISESLAPIGNHLWQSTVFAGVVVFLTFILRKNRAAVRYRLWLAASVKFLLPFSLLFAAGRHLQWPASLSHTPAAAFALPAIVSAVEGVSQPFAFEASTVSKVTQSVALPAVPAPDSQSADSQSAMAKATVWKRTPLVLLLVWLCGVAFVLILWFREWRRVRTSLKNASPVNLNLPIQVCVTESPSEPGILGILRPVLILPKGLMERLTPAQFDAVVNHEMCHVRRKDNLAAALHMVVEMIFWFHPMIWWIEKRLVEERERACDEAVISGGGEPETYAEGILNVCKFYKESALVCVSGVAGSDLKRRIEGIMGNRIAHKLSFSRTVLLSIAGILALAGPIAIGVVHATQSRNADAYAFSTLDVPGSTLTAASGIDISGRVVGYFIDGAGTHGFLFNNAGGGQFSTIDIPGAGWTAAFGISSTGQIVGGFGPAEAQSGRHGFLLSGGSLSTFDVPGSIDTIARSVNSRGQIVGEYTGTDGMRHGFRLSGGTYATIEIPQSGSSTANGINDSGQIVGLAGSGAGANAFLLDTSYSGIEYPNSHYTEVFGLNNVGDVVGQIDSPLAPFRGFRRSGSTFVLIDLPDSPSSWNALGINDLGQIVGNSTGRDGKTHGYLATPGALKVSQSNPVAITLLSNTPGGIGPTAIPGPAGPAGPPGPAGPQGPASVVSSDRPARGAPAPARTAWQFDAALWTLRHAADVLKTASLGNRNDLDRAVAEIELAVGNVTSAAGIVSDPSNTAASPASSAAIANFSMSSSDRGRAPRLEIALNNLSAASAAFARAPGGELGGLRAKTNGEIAAAANIIIAGIHAEGVGTAAGPVGLNATRDALLDASGALKKANPANAGITNSVMTDIGLAIGHVNSAIAFLDAHPNDTASHIPAATVPNFNLSVNDRGRAPSMEIALDDLATAYRTLSLTPGGDFGGYRTKVNDDLAAAVDVILGGIHSRGR